MWALDNTVYQKWPMALTTTKAEGRTTTLALEDQGDFTLLILPLRSEFFIGLNVSTSLL